jgi:hypothetical protein
MTRWIRGVAVAALCGAGLYGVLAWLTTPADLPLYLLPVESAGHEGSQRRVCADWLPIERTSEGWSLEWWIVLPKGSSLYSEIRSAKQLEFEIDPGSGLANVCVAEEKDSEQAPDIINAVLARCRPKLTLGGRVAPESRVALHLTHFDQGAEACGTPSGTPRLGRTPSNHALQADDRLPRFARAAARR